MENLIDETLLQTYLVDILVKDALRTKEHYHQFRVHSMNCEKHYIESTLITLHKAELIDTNTYKRLCRYFSKFSFQDCDINLPKKVVDKLL